MEEDNSGKVGLIAASVWIGGIVLIAGFFLLGYIGIMSMEKEQRGYIMLPNNYAVYQSATGGPGPYEIALRSDNKPVVKPNVVEVGWDDRYVFFKRTDGNLEEVGILDTRENNVKIMKSSEDNNVQRLHTDFNS
ncbi:hypothetical protein QJ48_15580 [Paenibacillus sp. A3]|uniref:hypothetical protein n=1 Tax=Paenibacillus sp. A3 TaxID=1337054 RepID=UPI0006D52C05|nr:hypothetical protein [Paenibacillus sp. A3]KPV58570.1 hypothetical protein QJ48_15580 [Paenibacillus sp. A3]